MDQCSINQSFIRPSHIIIRAFEGTKKIVIRDIDLVIEIKSFLFQVMDVHPPYFILLRRPLIHSTRVIPSIVHQQLKYVISRTLVTIKVKESLKISRNITILYIETKKVVETSFHSFEIVYVELVLENAPILKPSCQALLVS